MINFNSKNVNEQILCIAEQFNSEEPCNQLNVEKIKVSYNYKEDIEYDIAGILYNNDLEQLMKNVGYEIYEGKKHRHSIEILLKSIDENKSYNGFAFIIPDRHNIYEKHELFIDFNTFNKEI